MILGVRSFRAGRYKGVNVFLLKDWILPIDEMGREVFDTFDESLMRLRTDPQATRISLPGLDSSLTDLNTATNAALRSVPDRYRYAVQLFSSAVKIETDEPVAESEVATVLWTNLPAWCSHAVETSGGDFFVVKEGSHLGRPRSGWRKLELESSDFRLHVFPSGQTRVPSTLRVNAEPVFVRMGRLLDAHSDPQQALPSSSIAIHEAREEAV